MMREEHPDPSLFIGLHKLAEQNGDGLVPELYALLTRTETVNDTANVVSFPLDRRDPSGDSLPATPAKVLAFRR